MLGCLAKKLPRPKTNSVTGVSLGISINGRECYSWIQPSWISRAGHFWPHSAPWIVENWPFSEFLLLVDPLFRGVVWFSKLTGAIEPIALTLTTDLKTVSQISARHFREFWQWLGFANDFRILAPFLFFNTVESNLISTLF